MSVTRLRSQEIQVGQPLPMDVFDVHGKLLLTRGQVISTERQLERLIEEGLYSDQVAEANVSGNGAIHYHGHRVSVFALVREARAGMAAACAVGGARAVAAFGAIADMVSHACELDSDAALATILLQKEGAYASRHAINCAIVSQRVFAALGRPAAEQRSALCGVLSMNFGSEALHDTLFNHQAPLDEAQKQAVRAHPTGAAAALRACGVADALWLAVVEQHHESVDGSGYPLGLKAEGIHIAAQIAALADRYCEAVTGRGYRAGLMPSVALRDIFQKDGRGVSAALVAVLIRELGLYPPGSVVELANGDVAVVVKRMPAATKPVVRSLRNAMRRVFESPPKRLTSEDAYAVRNALPAEQAGQACLEGLWTDAFELETEAA